MKWGISFNVPATYESDLWGLPPPSQIERVQRWDGMQTNNILYHFQYSPQGWKEWQRLAGIKVQIASRVKGVKFVDYDPLEVEGKFYTVSELGGHFRAFVKFPQPMFPASRREAYKMLCMHAKRLHYEGLLYPEQLIATSIRFNASDPEGIRQTVKRALAAYKFALSHRDEWRVKLDPEERHRVLSESALKSAQVRRDRSAHKREKAKTLRTEGKTLAAIASILGISSRTASNYLK